MQSAGYGAGHRVALALDNRPEFFCHFLALARLGASIVPLNAAMGLAELRYVVGHADIALAMTHAGHAAHLRAALPGATPLHVIADVRASTPLPWVRARRVRRNRRCSTPPAPPVCRRAAF